MIILCICTVHTDIIYNYMDTHLAPINSSRPLHHSLSLSRQLPRRDVQPLPPAHEHEPPLPQLPSVPRDSTVTLPTQPPPQLLPHNNHPNPSRRKKHIQLPLLRPRPVIHLPLLKRLIGHQNRIPFQRRNALFRHARQERIHIHPALALRGGCRRTRPARGTLRPELVHRRVEMREAVP